MKRITLDRIRQAANFIDPAFLNSPQYFSEGLGSRFNNRILLKNEIENPIHSFKGRGADWLISQLHEEFVVCASAGNFGQGIAYAADRHKTKAIVFVSRFANPVKVERIKELGGEIHEAGDDFDEAKLHARKYASQHNLTFIEDGLALETIEGAGTIGLELVEYLEEELDYLLVPLGNGALINGIATVFKELSPNTRIIAVQSQGASAMIDSWREDLVLEYKDVDTIADGIAVRVPIPQALDDMKGLVDEGILIKDSTIIEAMKLINETDNLILEPSAAVGIAAVIENHDRFEDHSVGTILCGSNISENLMDKLFTKT
jgi:threonine dehydratase